MVSALDIAPTFLKLAGRRNWADIQGVDFAPLLTHPTKPVRAYAFAEKNWHDFEDHARMVRGRRFKLIHNAYRDLPQTPSRGFSAQPTFQAILQRAATGNLTEAKILPHRAPPAPGALRHRRRP